jgi:hypothetical protein
MPRLDCRANPSPWGTVLASSTSAVCGSSFERLDEDRDASRMVLRRGCSIGKAFGSWSCSVRARPQRLTLVRFNCCCSVRPKRHPRVLRALVRSACERSLHTHGRDGPGGRVSVRRRRSGEFNAEFVRRVILRASSASDPSQCRVSGHSRGCWRQCESTASTAHWARADRRR